MYFVGSDRRVKFELSEAQSDTLVLDADDFLSVLHCHWSIPDYWYGTERERLQYALLLFLVVYAASRPFSILEAARDKIQEEADVAEDLDFLLSLTEADAHPDCLKYKVIQLYKVRDRSGSGEDVIIIIITFRLMKDICRKGPLYFFRVCKAQR